MAGRRSTTLLQRNKHLGAERKFTRLRLGWRRLESIPMGTKIRDKERLSVAFDPEVLNLETAVDRCTGKAR